MGWFRSRGSSLRWTSSPFVVGLASLFLLTACAGQPPASMSADCKGVESWHLTTADRYERHEQELERVLAKLKDGSLTHGDLQDALRKVDVFVTAQERSNPPPAAAPLNALLVDGLKRYSTLFETALEGEYADPRAADAVMMETTEADKALREKCGLYQ